MKRPPSPSVLARLRERRRQEAEAQAATGAGTEQGAGSSATGPHAVVPRAKVPDAAGPGAAVPDAAESGAAHTATARGIRELGGPLVPVELPRRAAGERDVVIEIMYCGLCHSDVHSCRGEWGSRELPLVPGHEMVGQIVAAGERVTAHRVGDLVGVGVMVGSCGECEACLADQQMYCAEGAVSTYGAWDRFHDERTQGGYASSVVVDQDFVYRIPAALDPAAAAPLLCAGITSWAPLVDAGVGPGSRVAVAGLGGLGHLAVKLAVALGAEVTVLTTSAAKVDSAKALGATAAVLSTDEDAMAEVARSFDLIVDAIAAEHDLNALLRCLRPGRGRLALIGMPPKDAATAPVDTSLLSRSGLSVVGSKIGGVQRTQEMLDFCAEHGVATDIEMVVADELDEAWDRLVAGDVRYRFVLDASTL